MTTITYACPNCGRGRRSPGLCPACNDQARDEIGSILPGLAWILRLIWWQIRGVAVDLYRYGVGVRCNAAPILWQRRYFIGLVLAAATSLLLAAVWTGLKIGY